mmetsp:Transcript_12570/g.20500  ORF Transcript_12570/g.20500 Transcript_12570/m.20500 type:complete len:262 (+) Transcript_12570:1818-2603(+)
MAVFYNQVGVSLGRLPAHDRQQDSLVLDYQLCDDCSVSHWHGRHDSHSYPTPRLQSLQSVGDPRRCSRRDWMEAFTWRCFQTSSQPNAFVCACRNRHSSLWHGSCNSPVCYLGFPITSKSWRTNDSNASLVRVHGSCWRFFFVQAVQDVQGDVLEKEHSSDCVPVSGHRLWRFLDSQFAYMGPKVCWCRFFWHNVCSRLPLVWYLCASGVHWILLWSEKDADRAPSKDKPDTAAGAPAALVHELCAFDFGWGHPSLRRRLH